MPKKKASKLGGALNPGKSSDVVRINFEVPRAKREALKILAAQQRTTIKNLIESLIDQVITDDG